MHTIHDLVEPIRDIHAQMRDAVVATTEAAASVAELSLIAHDEAGVFSSCIHVDANGDIYPCVMLLRRSELRLGNITDPVPLDLASYELRRAEILARVAAEQGRASAGIATAPEGCLGYHLSMGLDPRLGDADFIPRCPTRYVPLC